MFTRLRSLATLLLFLAVLPAQAASGMVLFHLASDHVTRPVPAGVPHDEGSEHHHEAEAANHHADPSADHDSSHAHELALEPATPVRMVGADHAPQLLQQGWQAVALPVELRAPRFHMGLERSPQPPAAKRHRILLI